MPDAEGSTCPRLSHNQWGQVRSDGTPIGMFTVERGANSSLSWFAFNPDEDTNAPLGSSITDMLIVTEALAERCLVRRTMRFHSPHDPVILFYSRAGLRMKVGVKGGVKLVSAVAAGAGVGVSASAMRVR